MSFTTLCNDRGSSPTRMETRMNIGSVSTSLIVAMVQMAAETKQAPGPAHDSNPDKKTAAVQAAAADGVGKAVDVNA